jgi:hypothetical protein
MYSNHTEHTGRPPAAGRGGAGGIRAENKGEHRGDRTIKPATAGPLLRTPYRPTHPTKKEKKKRKKRETVLSSAVKKEWWKGKREGMYKRAHDAEGDRKGGDEKKWKKETAKSKETKTRYRRVRWAESARVLPLLNPSPKKKKRNERER